MSEQQGKITQTELIQENIDLRQALQFLQNTLDEKQSKNFFKEI